MSLSEINSIIRVIADLGKAMLMCGAEISRVEDTLSRLCRAYGFDEAEVFTVTSLILVSVRSGEKSVTQSRRITGYVINLSRLEELNSLSRRVCETLPSAEEFSEMLSKIIENSHFNRPLRLLGFVLCSAAFTVFFGGTARDAVCAGIISVIMFFIERLFSHLDINPLLYNSSSSFVAGLFASFLVISSFGQNPDKIMIGNIMLLIPGLALTNAIRDMMSGDTMSGFLRVCEALLTTVAIAFGFMLSMMFTGVYA